MSRHRIAFWGFRSPRDWVGAVLGTLERQIMDTAWSRPRAERTRRVDGFGVTEWCLRTFPEAWPE